jgi:ribonuclease P protein component
VVTAAFLDRSSDPPRVAYAVDRRLGTAVTRNTVRRRLRSAVREHAGTLEPGHAYLIRALPGAEWATYGDLSVTLQVLLTDLARTER